MIKYIDFDGVIFDTEPHLFDDKYYIEAKNPNFDKDRYVQNVNWYEIIKKSNEINDAIKILKEMKEAIILTKVNSLYNEANAKIRILREVGVRNNIILVPFYLKKTDVVNAEGNILVDDTVHNLDDWQQNKGIPIYFSKDGNNTDNWGNINTKYKSVKTLEYIRKI